MRGSPPDRPPQPLWTPSFIAACVLAFVARQWVTADYKRLPLGAPYDEANYVIHARGILDGTWFGAYSNITLIKGPFYPVFMAVVSDFGLPLHLAETLLYALACVVAVAAVAPLVRSSWWRIVIFVVLFFNPMSFESTTSRALRGDISGSLALLVIALTVWIFLRRERPAARTLGSIALGAALAAFLLTREEDVWIVVFVGLAGAALIAGSADRSPAGFVRRSIPAGIVALIVLSSYVAVATANYVNYGWFTPIEVTSTEFTAAYGALARIEPPGQRAAADPHIPVTLSMLAEAYRVSPAARELEPYLSGPPGRADIAFSCKEGGVCGDGIAAGWFLWSFRTAVAAAGHYHDGAEAARYFAALAAQIDDACAKRLVRCAPNARSLSPRIPLSAAPRVLAEAARAVGILAGFRQLSFEAGSVKPSQAVPDLFRSVTGDKLTLDDGNPADHPVKLRTAQLIGMLYAICNPILLAIALVALVIRVVQAVRARRFDDVAFLSLGIAAGAALLVLLLSAISVFSFPSLSPEYMKPLYAAMLFGALFGATADAERWLLAVPAVAMMRRRLEAVRGRSRPVWAPSDAFRQRLPYAGAGALLASLVVMRFYHPWGYRESAASAPAPFLGAPPVAASLPALGRPRAAAARLAALTRLGPASTASFDGALVLKDGAWSVRSLSGLSVPKGTPLKIVGWAADPKTMTAAPALLLVVDSKPRGDLAVDYGGLRPDVASAFHKPAMTATGYSAVLATSDLGAGAHVLQVGVVSANRKGYYLSRPLAFTIGE